MSQSTLITSRAASRFCSLISSAVGILVARLVWENLHVGKRVGSGGEVERRGMVVGRGGQNVSGVYFQVYIRFTYTEHVLKPQGQIFMNSIPR